MHHSNNSEDLQEIFLDAQIATLGDLESILPQKITSIQGYPLTVKRNMQKKADEHLSGDPLTYSDIYNRFMIFLEKTNDWVPAAIMYGKAMTAGYSPRSARAAIEKLKTTTNIGTSKDKGETLYRWYPRNEPLDTLNQKAIDDF